MSAFATTKKILTSLHGRLFGLSKDKKLVLFGKTALFQDDQGAVVQLQGAPVAVDATATLTIADLLAGIITSTTAAAVAGTVPTGTLTDGGFTGDNALAVGEGFAWSVINTGGANAFTVTAGTDHTLVGAGAVAASTSGRFFTRKTAANTFVTYRLA